MQIIKGARGRITGHFGDENVPGAHVSQHKGMDIGHGDMTAEDLMVFASRGGKVSAWGRDGTYGNRLIIDHGYYDGAFWQTLFAHLEDSLVGVGAVFGVGAHIATMGNTGGDWPTHLHQELRRNGIPVNPENYLVSNITDGDGGFTPAPPTKPTAPSKPIPVPVLEDEDMNSFIYLIASTSGGAVSKGACYILDRKSGKKRHIGKNEWAIIRADEALEKKRVGDKLGKLNLVAANANVLTAIPNA